MPIPASFIKSISYSLMLILLALPAVSWAQENKSILVVHAYSQEYPWTKGQHQGFLDTITGRLGTSVNIDIEYLDTKRIAYNREFAEKAAEYIVYKHSDHQPDAIYVTDDNGLSFARDYLSTVFSTTPFFFSGVNNYSVLEKLDKNRYTGVFEKKEFVPNLDILKLFQDKSYKINIVGDNSNTYLAIKKELNKELQHNPHIQTNYIAANRIDQLEKALQNQQDFPVLLTTVGAIHSENGEPMHLSNIIQRIHAASSGIVISMEDAYLYDNILGGYVTSGQAQGRAAAELMIAYLSGKPVSEIKPITESPNEYIFNDSVLESLDIELPEVLKKQSKLLNPRLDFFDRYRDIFLGILLAISAALVTLLILYSIDVTSRNRQLHKQSEIMKSKSRQLKESENRFQLLFNRSQNPILIIRDGRILSANRAAAKTFGIENPNQQKTINLVSLAPEKQPDGESSQQKAQAMLALAWDKGFHSFEWTWYANNKTSVVELSLTRIPYDEQDALYCICLSGHAQDSK